MIDDRHHPPAGTGPLEPERPAPGAPYTLHPQPPERAIAVGVVPHGTLRAAALDHLDELEFLAQTAGAEVVMKIAQERARPDVATVIGRGKVGELAQRIGEEGVTLAIFDDDLSPAQARNLERAWEIKVLDRSGLILDIFAARARSTEARLQVELAQLQYLLPRLSRLWTHLSKQFGGIGTKGPGETQIETDRRLVRARIATLKEKIAAIDVQKREQRKQRTGLMRFALVGYTNAGKSTLMNVLTGAGVRVEHQLFATLDTTTRTFTLPGGRKALLSDTVGFIRKLPPHLVASFRSTLAEAREADVLLHVVDAAHPAFRDHVHVVRETLDALRIADIPTLTVLNKIDALHELGAIHALQHEFPDALCVSAARGINLPGLLASMQRLAETHTHILDVMIPYAEGARLARLYDEGEVLERRDAEEGTRVRVRLREEEYRRLRESYQPFALHET